MIYLSLFERRVVVLVDDGVMKACGQTLVSRVRDLALKRLAEGKRTDTFTDAIQSAAEQLAQAMPIKKDDTNELSDRLLIFYPRP